MDFQKIDYLNYCSFHYKNVIYKNKNDELYRFIH